MGCSVARSRLWDPITPREMTDEERAILEPLEEARKAARREYALIAGRRAFLRKLLNDPNPAIRRAVRAELTRLDPEHDEALRRAEAATIALRKAHRRMRRARAEGCEGCP